MSNPYDPYNTSGNPDGGAGSGSGPDAGGAAGQGGTPPPPPPYGQPPYPQGDQGQPPYPQGGQGQPPYGQDPYGQGAYAAPAPTRTDAVSITGFVLALTCFLSPIGLILGLVGLSRTKKGQRKGRWAAIAAIPLGLVFTIVGGLIVAGVVFVAQQVITPGNAEVGQCIDVSRDGSDYNLLKQDCTETHDAEIIYVGVASDYEDGLGGTVNPAEVCTSLMAPEDLTSLQGYEGDLVINLIIRDPEDIEPDDEFLCFVEPSLGSLDEPLL